MRCMITDSGLGGLSVCAGLEQALAQRGVGSDIELLYVNATPDDRIGYNALETQSERIALFHRFLQAACRRFAPDEIVIACNTLSVIYADTEFSKQNLTRVRGIVEAGVALCNTSLAAKPEYDLIVFATETTTEADTYPRSIAIDADRIAAQACPGLAHAISNDASGAACRKKLTGYAAEALDGFKIRPAAVLAFLGCTHYGYQARVFQEVLESHQLKVGVLNPNDLLVEQVLGDLQAHSPETDGKMTVRFVSRYPIPRAEIESMQSYLSTSAPRTLTALQNQEVIPDFFR